MKRCPECNDVYSEQLDYCLKDGRPLIPVAAVDDDYDTVVRPDQIVIDLEGPASPADPVYPDNIPPQPLEKERVSTVAVLIAGTLIGGLLVLIGILAFYVVSNDRPGTPSNQGGGIAVKNSNTAKPTPTERPQANIEVVSNSTKDPAKTTPLTKETPNEDDSDQARQERLIKKGFNGRVIMINAVLRSSPSIDSPEVTVLPFDAPVKIGKPAGGNNPWYRVTTEDGTTGWMHGNTIEFIN